MVFLLRSVGAVLIALGVMLAVPLRAELAQGDVAPYNGPLLYLNNGEVWRLDLTSGAQSRFLRVEGGLITSIAHSLDRRQLAYAVTYYGDGYSVRGSDIVVCDADGSNPRTAVHEEAPGYYVGWVSWPSDPGRLMYGKVNWGRGLIERIEEVDLATGTRELVVEPGAAPAASPADAMLAYQTRAGQRWHTWTLDRRTGARTEVVKTEWFEDADHPTFAPDGSSVAFVAAGDGPQPADRELPLRLSLSLFETGQPRVASAHDLVGVLFDLWLVQPNGEGLRRVVQLFDAQPEIAWSPSGRHIAALGAFQLQIVDVATGATRGLPRPQGNSPFGGPISWG